MVGGFCFQSGFATPTLPVDEAQFYALVRASRWNECIDRFRETGDASLKRKLPAFIFQARFDETVSKRGKLGRWRKQAATRLTGLVVMDVDHVGEQTRPQPLPREGSNMNLQPRELFAKWQNEHPELFSSPLGDKRGSLLLIYITPSGHGLKIVFKADVAKGNLIDNQHAMAEVLGVEVDESCKDSSRMSFICKESDILYLDKELFTYENKEFAEKYDEEYRKGKSGQTNPQPLRGGESNPQVPPRGDLEGGAYHGVPYQQIIDAWSKQRFSKENASRHEASVTLARDLYIMTDRNKRVTLALLMAQPWVQEIIDERQEDVERNVDNAADYVAAQEKKNAKEGKPWMPKISKEMKAVLEALQEKKTDGSTNLRPSGGGREEALPLDSWASQLQEMAKHYPCMKELFLNVHPHKLPAVWFASAALFGTLMTRAFYHFWYDPELVRRLNYCIFIIGDPGAGKNIVEKFYKKIADPMIQADQCLIDAVNRYKEGRTERTTSTKAQKGEALKRPVVGIRVHPARTATGEFIRHMNAAVETIEGLRLNLHMFSFDAELDNVTKQNKGGDWKDREIMELKAFHNEEDGQMYANQESVTGMFNVFWNFIYTGTPYALHRKVNQRNFGTGMSTRLAVIPLPDKGIAQRHQKVDPNANETLRTWAYRLDKVEGEMPIEALNDETYDWQSARLEIAEFNDDKADKTLLKRIPYYGIGISLPFILMRHWKEWEEKKTITMDSRDRQLCRLAMEIQYRCQQFYFGEMAFNYFADQDKEFVQRRRTTRYDVCFRKLPDEFKTQQFMEVFGCSQPTASKAIARFVSEGIVEKVKYGMYRKLVQELP